VDNRQIIENEAIQQIKKIVFDICVESPHITIVHFHAGMSKGAMHKTDISTFVNKNDHCMHNISEYAMTMKNELDLVLKALKHYKVENIEFWAVKIANAQLQIRLVTQEYLTKTTEHKMQSQINDLEHAIIRLKDNVESIQKDFATNNASLTALDDKKVNRLGFLGKK